MRRLTPLLLIALMLVGAIGAGAQPANRVFLPLLAGPPGLPTPVPAGSRTVNAPFFDVADLDAKFAELGIFWFGTVRPDANYSDVRVGYSAQELYLYVATIDRRLWHADPAAAAAADLTGWDAVELLIDTAGQAGDAPRPTSVRLLAGFSGEPEGPVRERYERAFRGDGARWAPAQIGFTTRAGWRGDGLNDDRDDKGWAMSFRVPFSALGLSRPAPGDRWAIGLRVHDRDAAAGALLPVTPWPERATLAAPATWGSLRFGLPSYAPPAARNPAEVLVRQGLGGAQTPDGAVGGGATCGGGLDYWTQWGEQSYYRLEDDPTSEPGDFNVQNQSDISDWPCFSKYYITFPLDGLPRGKVITSARLVLHLYGSAGPDKSVVQPSLIQVLTVAESWDEATLTWNSAPLASANFGGSWVNPPPERVDFPGIPYELDVAVPLAEAYAAGQPLRLALYSADSAYHSGKYFISADTGDWNAAGRPTLRVTLGDPAP